MTEKLFKTKIGISAEKEPIYQYRIANVETKEVANVLINFTDIDTKIAAYQTMLDKLNAAKAKMATATEEGVEL